MKTFLVLLAIVALAYAQSLACLPVNKEGAFCDNLPDKACGPAGLDAFPVSSYCTEDIYNTQISNCPKVLNGTLTPEIFCKGSDQGLPCRPGATPGCVARFFTPCQKDDDCNPPEEEPQEEEPEDEPEPAVAMLPCKCECELCGKEGEDCNNQNNYSSADDNSCFTQYTCCNFVEAPEGGQPASASTVVASAFALVALVAAMFF